MRLIARGVAIIYLVALNINILNLPLGVYKLSPFKTLKIALLYYKAYLYK